MELIEVQDRIAAGEDSFTQFKRELNSVDALSAELCAFVNAEGGWLIIGVNDDKTVQGISNEQEAKNEQWVLSALNEGIVPPVHALTRNHRMEGMLITTIVIKKGLRRPYRTKKGKYWTKSGAGKRLLTTEEIERLARLPQKTFEELAIITSDIKDVDQLQFSLYFDSLGKGDLSDFLEKEDLALEQLLSNLRLGEGANLTLPGLLFFIQNPQRSLPTAYVQAVNFSGIERTDQNFVAKANFTGTLKNQFTQSLLFIVQSMRTIPNGKGFNNEGKMEIPNEVFEELLINALVHRDYSIRTPIQLFIFKDRVEITSPGALYNSLTVENIKLGITRRRNPILSQFASKILPYSGMGTGIGRALKNYEDIELINNQEGHQFQVVISRPQL